MALHFLNSETNTLQKAVFCFTGKAPKTRSEMEKMANKAGASVTKNITNRTTILVIADPASQSSKARKARKNNLHLISPEQFFEMCNDVIKIVKIDNNTQLSLNQPSKSLGVNYKKNHSTKRIIRL